MANAEKSVTEEIAITVTREDRYRFTVDFGPDIAKAVADEPPPLGEGAGPSPAQLLAAAVANCLSASLIFAHGKFKEDPGRLTAAATCEIGRNEKNRLRVIGMKVAITLGVAPESLGHLDRALMQFEDFCTVSQSVRNGIPLTVTVKGPDGRVLK
jgi:organic hydroperoxide reductase OsmC/OhrA